VSLQPSPASVAPSSHSSSPFAAPSPHSLPQSSGQFAVLSSPVHCSSPHSGGWQTSLSQMLLSQSSSFWQSAPSSPGWGIIMPPKQMLMMGTQNPSQSSPHGLSCPGIISGMQKPATHVPMHVPPHMSPPPAPPPPEPANSPPRPA
jgi:hypothetical protein